MLRDGGTFSYNAGQSYIDYYGGTASHNTIQFDDHEQMPRLGRFLLGAWLKSKDVFFDGTTTTAGAGYKDSFGSQHYRKVTLKENKLEVVDKVKGIINKAILRWRLCPGNWSIDGSVIKNGNHSIFISSKEHINRIEIVEGKESRYYYHENSIPVLEIEFSTDGTITTEYRFHS